ncbi:MAG: hypothetical protein R3325_10035 [Thermoanaerobaculia bacterium]|nr:hypothetical protein [Thermoanaerobaculia bacterium]
MTLLTVLRWLAAGLVGFLVISLGTTLVLEVWFDGVTFHTSSPTVLVVSGVANFLVGIAGGVVAALLGGRRPLVSAAVIGGWVTLDTINILRSDRFDDPAWFTLLAGVGLVTAALVGGWAVRRHLERRKGDPGGASSADALRAS